MNVSDVSAIGSNCFTQMLLKLTFEEVFFVKVRTCVVLRSMAFNVCRWSSLKLLVWSMSKWKGVKKLLSS